MKCTDDEKHLNEYLGLGLAALWCQLKVWISKIHWDINENQYTPAFLEYHFLIIYNGIVLLIVLLQQRVTLILKQHLLFHSRIYFHPGNN